MPNLARAATPSPYEPAGFVDILAAVDGLAETSPDPGSHQKEKSESNDLRTSPPGSSPHQPEHAAKIVPGISTNQAAANTFDPIVATTRGTAGACARTSTHHEVAPLSLKNEHHLQPDNTSPIFFGPSILGITPMGDPPTSSAMEVDHHSAEQQPIDYDDVPALVRMMFTVDDW